MPDADAPPRPARRPETRRHHGHEVVDPYAWLRDADDPATLRHLRDENAWTERVTAPLAGLREDLFGEIERRTQEDDTSVPVREGAWWYHQRTEKGRSYPIRVRRADDGTGTAPTGPEHVVLDLNDLVEDGDYLGLGVLDVSPDGNWLAYAVDRSGDERHDLHVRDLRTGEEAPEVLREVSFGFAWAADSATFWYTLQDESSRPDRVLRHVVGADPTDDVLVVHEPDERFHVAVHGSRSQAVAVVSMGSAVTSESWLLDAHAPESDPVLVAAREQDVEYSVAHHPTGLLVVSNHGGAEDFALWRAPLDGTTTAPRSTWECLIPHRPGTRIDGVEAFADHVVVHGRAGGLTALWHLDPSTGGIRPLATDEPVGTIAPGTNPSFDTDTYRLTYQSLRTPPSVYDEDLRTGERVLRKRLPVLDGFDPADYSTAREWAVADDGTEIPISLVWRTDARPTDGPAPLLLYGYGAYEASMDPWFSIARLSLLDRGVVFAIAHVRGGGELGRRWYEDGKFGHKEHTFTDFVACARHLVAEGTTTPDRLAARGGSAGGLLMGAVANLAPDLFRAIVAEVPFVDPLTTMLDPSLPLTVIEWEEWGDPLHDPAAYDWIAGYSPYENVAEGAHPAILATAGLSDPRVGFHEPAKWVARLRDRSSTAGDASLDGRPVLLKVEMGSGHAGPSGRYDAWRDEAFVLAFVLRSIVGR
ncbi:MAG: S9 family peptidase [Actinobacteria bacterium]|nr:S9 family peptidase [Actinomycetota bacterium]